MDDVSSAQLAYWRGRLAGAALALELPADHPRPARRTLRAGRACLRLAPEAAARLRRTAAREGVPLDALLLAGLAALLARYSGQEDLAIGVPGGDRADVLLLRLRLAGEAPFRDLVAAAREAALGAFAHADLPLAALAEALGLAGVPPPQVMLAAGRGAVGAAGATLAGDLALGVREVEDAAGEPALALDLAYAAELFAPPTAARLLAHYAALLDGAAPAPELPLARLPLLTAAERHQLAAEWNDTALDLPPRALHRLFAAQAAARPDAVAVSWEGGALTYGGLDRRSGRMARRLRRLGVGPESRVGLSTERSGDMVAAVLAILKAGGGYLPLDPAYPRERLELLLADARPAAVAGPRRLLAALPGAVPSLAFEDLEPADEEARDGADAGAEVPAGGVALVLYTSGSTGTPKGVELGHEAVARLVCGVDYMPFGPGDVFLQLAPMSFDAATFELWAPLLHGGRLALLRPGPFALADLHAAVAEEGVTALFLTTGLFHLAVEEGLAGLAGLRHLLSGGDAMSRTHMERALAALPEVEILHCYGPAENATYSTTYAARRGLGEASVPIGRPLAGRRAYVLDGAGEPLPIGCAGELHVGGVGLARGYLGRPELTAERFVPNPFSRDAAGGRLYRTGDLARWRPDGTLDFLGRRDFQVKVRGFRVEPGEVESALLRHPRVREAVVVGLAEGARDHRLVAYYALAEPGAASAAELRAHLRERLPAHMVPSAFVELPALPLTASGKVDRRALPSPASPAAGGTPLDPLLDPPLDPIEQAIAGVWEDLLGGERRVGAHDDFFDLGGHSLLAMRLLSRLRETLGVELGIQALFASPTPRALARAVAAARRGTAAAALPPLAPAPRDGPSPLSFAQRRLWFLDRLMPGATLYNVPSGWRVRGPLAPAALAAALAEVVRRHQPLRTRFVEVDGEPRQVVDPAPPLPLPVVDLAGLGEAAGRELARLRREQAERPFDLARGPLLRALLARLGPEVAKDEHALLLAVHHIAYDGWSEGVLAGELAALYAAAEERRPSPLPEPPVQYADYAAWQHAWPPELLAGQLAWWRERLAGAPAAVELPADHPRPAVQSFRGAVRELLLPAATAARLRRAARREGATLYMLLFAGFAALLARCTGEEDLVIGTPVANRARPEVEGLIGFFVNTLPLRARLDGDPEFRRLLASTRQEALAAFAHQDLPFEALVEALQPARDPSRSPLVQVLLALQSAGRAAAGAGARDAARLRLAPLPPAERTTARFDLALMAEERDDGNGGAALALDLELALDLFTATTASRLLAQYATLLDGAAAAPELPLSRLPLLSAAERHQVAAEWNDTASAPPRHSVHRLFEAVAAARPDAAAVEWDGGSLTYGALDRRAGRIARELGRLGVGPEARVALCAERSADMVAAVVGILKAGGAYLPLDPAYPRRRLELLLADAAPAAAVGPRRLLAALPGEVPRLAYEDLEDDAGEDAGIEVAGVEVAPGGLAYVLYTSGSTGAPKGVEVAHASVVRLVREAGYAAFGSGEVFLQLVPMAFDVSTFELWGPLLHGGRLALLPPGPFGLADVYGAVERHGVTTLWLTSGLFHLAVEEGLGALGGLRQLLAGGDALSRPHALRALAALPGVEIVDGYGPTENTTFSTTHRLRSGLGEGSVPIGRPIAASRAVVLDGALAPLPIGCPGELYVGGAGLARGYLGRPDLTAERFLPDSLGPDPFSPAGGGGRLYRTGDLARWLPDGTLEFLGRRDVQVKVRGFRVEPGEVESVLLRHPRVREAAVAGVADGARDRRLVAYYAAAEPVAAAALAGFLRERLPEHMVPSAFVELASLPLTPNGKVDRRALPAPPAAAPEAGAAAPRDPLEEVIAGIWQEVLGLDRPVGADESFFHLGGHSLLAIRMLSRLRRALGVEIAVQALFASPTVRGLARRVSAARGRVEAEPLPPLPPLARGARRDGPLALSFAQRRLWFLDRLAPGGTLYNVPSAWRVRGPLAPAALAAALAEVLRRHEALRTRFVEVDGEPGQEIDPPGPVPLPVVDLTGLGALQPAALARLQSGEARRPFDLARGPLLRALLARLGDGEHALLASLHHIVYDGWSEAVLLRELAALHGAALAGRPSPLAEPSVQYADYAAWQHAWPPEVLAAQLAWWRGRLAGAPAAIELPADHPRPAVQSFRGAVRELLLPADAAARLRQAARREGATLYMLLFAGFAALLARYTGEEDLVIGTPVANRARPEVEGLIGFFVNTLPFRARLDGEAEFRRLLASTREEALAAFAHQDLPFEALVEALRPERDLGRNPIVQVLLALQSAGLPAAAPPSGTAAGLRFARLPWPARTTAKFDLAVAIEELEPATAGAGPGLLLEVEHATDLFDGATAARLLAHYAALLAGAAAAPELPLSRLPLLAPAERHQLAAEWNDTAAEPQGATLHRLVEEQAAARPDAVAVAWDEGRLTYGELDRRSGRIASRLSRLGVGCDALVGVSAERSGDMVAALLGILKAGGAYLPLDPGHPRERLALLLADAAPAAVAGPRRLLAALPGTAPRLAFEDLADAADGADDRWTRPEVPPEALAYVLYTSGSTGKPKGVGVSHRSVARLVRDSGFMSFGPGEVFLQLAPLAFDASTVEIWGPLVHGGRLALLAPGRFALQDVYAAVGRHGVTTLALTAGLFHVAVEEGLAELAGLHHLLAGGDVVSRDHLLRAVAALPGVEILHCYGPTENTTFSTTQRARSGLGETSPPIGRPLARSAAHVLDAALAPAPIGCPGELYVGGAGLARGYLGRPDLTAERFVPDPLSPDPLGARLYRTGDLARRLPDGTLEFLGRRDRQVKVRGFRIEPGEVESALLRHPGVREALVVALAEGVRDRRLVAYWAPAPGAARASAAELRDALRARLPEPLVPSAFVEVAALPLTPSGKVDRRALPPPPPRGSQAPAGGPGTAAPRDLPRDRVEEAIAAIWRELLDLDRPAGIHESFFHLGGHSLLATRLLSRIQRALGVELPVQAVFESPTIAGLAAAVRRAGRSAAALPPLARLARRDGPLPLSYAQRRLWFLDRLAPGSPLYGVPSGWLIGGPLAPAALAAALSEVVRRHEALRTRFVERDGEPWQEIDPPGPVPLRRLLPTVDLAGLGALARAELARLQSAAAARPFDLARGPLLRALLARLGDGEHALLLDLHHIVYDGWSEGVLLGELAALHGAALAGRPSPLAELPVQYADYAAWQRAWPPEVLAGQLDWWRERLAGAPAAIELPADRARPPVQSFRGAARSLLLPADVAARLRQAARRQGATLYMLLLAGFAALLARYSGEEDLVIGAPVANRGRPEVEGLVGFFVNTLPLRLRLDGDPEFGRLLAATREEALAAFAHQDLPFEALVEALAPERDRGRHPLVQVMLSLQSAGRPAAAAPAEAAGAGLRFAPLPWPARTTAKFDLAVAVEEVELEEEPALLLEVEHATCLFSGSTAARLLAHYAMLLEGASAAPELPLSRLPLLSAAERHQAIREWNDTASAFPRDSVHRLFEAVSAARPDAVAVEWDGGSLTYGALDRRAGRIARALHGLGVEPEARVALSVERSADMVAGVVGILKAGGAYLPLDPAYPRERLELLLADAAPAAAVGPRRLLAALSREVPRLAYEELDDDADSGEEAGIEVAPEGLAYVLYTSGSTGTPKGVEVSHAAVVRLVREAGYAAFGPGEVFLPLVPMAFDVSTFELWGPLLHGGRLALLPPGPFGLVDVYGAVARHGVTTLWLTSGLFHHVLDGELGPLPIGCPGELYVGGAGLARGYLGRPDLTAERFIPDPFGEGRLYRTGDLARRLPDGTLEFLGRRDRQVKVRGVRIEPGEVESALLGHPGVREALVVALAEGVRERRLVAYWAPWPGAARASAAELHEFLRARLPEPLVPSAFVEVAALPLTPNSKVDHRALPPPFTPPAAPAPEAVRPRSPLEEVIAGIWEEVLELDRPAGIHDDFFHLGGHSLLVTRLLSRIRRALGVELPVQTVFESPTVAGLARAVAAAGRREPRPVPPPLVPLARRDGLLPLSYPQQRLWFLQRLAPESATYNIPSGFRLRGPLDPAALCAALSGVVARHAVLRTAIVEAKGEPEPRQEIRPPAPLPLAEADLSALPPARREGELARLWRSEAARPFDLARDPVLRSTLARLGGGEHALLLTIHHAASDGWSTGVLHRELAALYAAARAGRPSPLPPLRLQYADYGAWQRAWPAELLDGQLAYWREELAGTPALELPADRPRPAAQSFRGGSLALDLPPGLGADLRRLARDRGATLFMVALAGWQALLQRLSGQDDFAVGTPVANRTRPELEELVGCFVNTLALRARGSREPGGAGAHFAGRLERARSTALAAYDHADVPFERLVDELNPARDRSRQPLLQTMLALDSTVAAPLALDGLAVEELPWSGAVSRFDLSLGLAERHGEGGGRLAGQLEYSADLFDAATMTRLGGHLATLLAAVAADPERRLDGIDLLSAAERHQAVVEANDTATDYAGDHRLHRWIERQAARTPGEIAVVGERETLSYAELNARANRLARHLRALGIQVGAPVGICAERSPELVVGLVAILKAGGAYLPLDPSYPPERLAFMVEDGLGGAPAPLLLAQARFLPLLADAAAAAGARRVGLDDAAGLAAGDEENLGGGAQQAADLDGGAGPDDLAYVIYTSGSTGRPKGAMNTHRAIVNRLLWMQEAYGLGPADRVLQKTPVSFDVSVWELFWPLMTGARLVLARPGGHRDPGYLARRIEEQGVTTLHFVPAMLQAFLEQPAVERCASLKRVIASGEALSPELARRFFALLPQAELHNLYGPTEAAVDVTFHACASAAALRSIPIGRPIANCGIWLLDGDLLPVPLGVPGELYIGGAGLARGYLRRPELTAARFVPHPFGSLGARLYRTGDLARRLPGGEIDFLGRADDQVKLRGFRVEPGEIEAVLAAHPRVLEAAVVARRDRPGEVRLVAFVVPAGAPDSLAGELREALRRRLPEHMVPAGFVLLESLPATPNGKLDRRALATLPLPEESPEGEAAPPETETEALLIGIWRQLLGRERIGVCDNLFDLGAHSLLAPQFVARVEEVFGVVLPMHALFDSPTVKQLAVAVQDALIALIESMTDEEAALAAGSAI